MRYQLVPENNAEARGLSANPAAAVLFDPFLPVLQARAIMAAGRFGIFEQLSESPRSAADLAGTLSLDAETLDLLLRVLACAGYLSPQGETYQLTDRARAALLPGSPAELTGWVKHSYLHWSLIGELEGVLKTGRGTDSHQRMTGADAWAAYQQAMLETARPAAGVVAEQVPVPPGARRMIDIGGGHGLYGAMICRRHPPLICEVLELPAAIASARAMARREGIEDVVSHRAGDAATEDLGKRVYDVAFLGNLIHHLTTDQNRDLLARLRLCLRPGGTVAVWDFRYPEAGSPPDLVADGFALLFRIGSSTRGISIPEYSGWMTDAGFSDVEEQRLAAPTHALVTGRVTG